MGQLMLRVLLIILIFHVLESQTNEPRNLLTLPKPELCAGRSIHSRLRSTGYYFSWLEPETKGLQLGWFQARNFCRDRCMDLISLENLDEISMLRKYIQFGNVEAAWTSGRLCDFNKCDRKDLLPLNINGWFWSGSGQKMHPTTKNSPHNDWSSTGGLGHPQPDNREGGGLGGQGLRPALSVPNTESNEPEPKNEACLAYLNNFYKDGIRWHDLRCDYAQSFVCEESPVLLKYAQAHSQNLTII